MYRFHKEGDWWVCHTRVRFFPEGPQYALFLFDEGQFNHMLRNYREGNSPLGEKGLFRYCTGFARLRNEKPVRGLLVDRNRRALLNIEWRVR